MTSPNQNIGDVSQASPVGLTPVLLRPFTFPPFAFHFLLPMQCISSRSSFPLLASHFSHLSCVVVAYILSCFFLVPFQFRPWKGWDEYMACCGHTSYLCPLHPGEFAFLRHLDPLICFCRAHRRDKQTDHPTCVATGRIFTLCIAMRPENYSERQNWQHQFRGKHDDETMKYRQTAAHGKIKYLAPLVRHCNTMHTVLK